MKKRIVLLLLVLILLPAGIIRSKWQPISQQLTARIVPAAFYLHTDAFPIIPELNQLPTNASLANYIVQISSISSESVNLYDLVELDLRTNLPSINPYDPNSIDLKVSFNAPSGKEVQVGAFWYQDFDSKTRMPAGEPGWKVRFTPDEVGKWVAVAYDPALGLHSTPVSFIVQPFDSPGFIHVNVRNPRYLAYDNGDFFFPIGVNMAWWSGGGDPMAQYKKWLEAFTANGGNTIRVWMASWSFGIEWDNTGLGNYDNRQYEAWQLDLLFRLAQQYKVKIILVLINHGAFSLETNSEWSENPYNAALGGPLNRPEQFTSDLSAKSYFKQRLNYIINRWGYSPELLAWEWFNEVNLTPITDNALIPWLAEMTAYLATRDVNHHLTTSSFALRTQSQVWKLPGLDIIQTHEYSSQTDESEFDFAGRAAQDFQNLIAGVPLKPVLMGEFGYSADNYGDDIEKTGIHLHNGLWATTFAGYTGSGMYWWWDIYIDANNLWHQFKGLASFLDGVNLAVYQPFSSLRISRASGSGGQAVGMGLRGADILVWLRSDSYTVQAAVAASSGKLSSGTYMPPLSEDLFLTLTDMPDGNYTVRWFDPQQAVWLDEQLVTVKNGTLVVPIPAFRDDLAAKITRNP